MTDKDTAQHKALRLAVGKRVRKLRRLRDLVQEDIEAGISFSRQTYHHIEHGKGYITIERLYELATFHGVSILHFLPDGAAQVEKFQAQPHLLAEEVEPEGDH